MSHSHSRANYSFTALISRLLERRAYAAAVVFVTALVLRLLYLVRILQVHDGVRVAGDTPAFRRSCQILATEPLNVVSKVKGLMYLGFNIPFCVVEWLSGGSGLAWVLVQILVSASTAVLVFYIGSQLTNRVGGFVAGMSIALLFDTFRYTAFLLAETTFVFVFVLTIGSLVAYKRNPGTRRRAAVFGSMLWLSTTRPFGMPIVACWLALDILPSDSPYRLNVLPRWFATSASVILPAIILVFSSARRKLKQVEIGWREGWILYQGKTDLFFSEYVYTPRPSGSFVEFVLVNADHIVVMSVLRSLVLYVPLVDAWESPFWNVFNALVLVPLLLGSIYGGVKAIRRRPDVATLLLSPIVVVTAVVSVTLVSMAWRYRAPLGPVFALLTGYAVSTLPQVEAIADRLGD